MDGYVRLLKYERLAELATVGLALSNILYPATAFIMSSVLRYTGLIAYVYPTGCISWYENSGGSGGCTCSELSGMNSGLRLIRLSSWERFQIFRAIFPTMTPYATYFSHSLLIFPFEN